MSRSVPRSVVGLVVGVLVPTALFAALLTAFAGQPTATLVTDNIGQLLAAVAATVASVRAAREATACARATAADRVVGAQNAVRGSVAYAARHDPPHDVQHDRWARHGSAQAWALLAASVGCWAGGQAVWSWYEIVAGRAVPFPSWADVEFVAFPLLAAAGLRRWMYTGRAAAFRTRDLFDAALIAGSLLALSWQTTLAAVYEADAANWLAFGLSLAYPCGDIVLMTLVLHTLARSPRAERVPLLLLSAGLGGLALADSVFVYLSTTGGYASGNLISVGWVGGFLLIAAAAHAARTADAARGRRSEAREPATGGAGTGGALVARAPLTEGGWLALILPYGPLLVAGSTLALPLLAGRSLPVGEVALGLLLVVLVLARQFVVLAENRALVTALREREAELAHQAFHDPLTGLANRALFLDRVEQLVSWHQRDQRTGAVLFCDLDDFKQVNDSLGHAAGDAYLVAVATRLRTAVRAVDTVARLGGDEFAVLLEAPHDPVVDVAARIVEALSHAVPVHGRLVPSSVSVGVATLAAPPPSPSRGTSSGAAPGADRVAPPTCSDLLAAADQAMYLAKAAGKGCHAVASLAR